MVTTLHKAGAAVNAAYKYSACLLMVVLIAACFLQVFTRYVMNASLAWTEELARYVFIWFNMLAASVAVKHGVHAFVNLFEGRLKGKLLFIQRFIVYFCILLGAFLMVFQGIRLISMIAGKPSIIMRIPMEYIYLAVPVGGFGIFVQAGLKMLDLFFPRKEASGQ